MSVNVKIKLLDEECMPYKATEGSVGYDLKARKHVVIPPHEWRVVPAGFKMELPTGYEAQIRPRSGLASKHGITVLNTPGTIDSDYRGEVGVILINHSHKHFVIEKGMRIAQMVIKRVEDTTIQVVEDLTDTNRGAGGFGSTGLG
jgi:dUTP pyrophosphatase